MFFCVFQNLSNFFLFHWSGSPHNFSVGLPLHGHFISKQCHASDVDSMHFISLENRSIWLNIVMKLYSKQSCHIHRCDTLYENHKTLHQTSENSIFLPGKYRCPDGGHLLLACCLQWRLLRWW